MEFKRNVKIYMDDNNHDIYHEFDVDDQFEENCLLTASSSLEVYLNNKKVKYDYDLAEDFFQNLYEFIHNEYWDDEILNEKINNLLEWYFKPEKIVTTVNVTVTTTFSVEVETEENVEDFAIKRLARNLMEDPKNQLNRKKSINYEILN